MYWGWKTTRTTSFKDPEDKRPASTCRDRNVCCNWAMGRDPPTEPCGAPRLARRAPSAKRRTDGAADRARHSRPSVRLPALVLNDVEAIAWECGSHRQAVSRSVGSGDGSTRRRCCGGSGDGSAGSARCFWAMMGGGSTASETGFSAQFAAKHMGGRTNIAPFKNSNVISQVRGSSKWPFHTQV